jgi:hypothetical protein
MYSQMAYQPTDLVTAGLSMGAAIALLTAELLQADQVPYLLTDYLLQESAILYPADQLLPQDQVTSLQVKRFFYLTPIMYFLKTA